MYGISLGLSVFLDMIMGGMYNSIGRYWSKRNVQKVAILTSSMITLWWLSGFVHQHQYYMTMNGPYTWNPVDKWVAIYK